MLYPTRLFLRHEAVGKLRPERSRADHLGIACQTWIALQGLPSLDQRSDRLWHRARHSLA